MIFMISFFGLRVLPQSEFDSLNFRLEKLQNEQENAEEELKQLQTYVTNLEAQGGNYQKLYHSSVEALKHCEASGKLKDEALKALQDKLFLNGDDELPAPAFLDQARPPYRPVRTDYQKRVTTYNPLCYYNPCWHLKKLVKDKKWRALPHEDKILKIWEYVAIHLEYAWDKQPDGTLVEDWQTSCESDIMGQADCEDSTILFVTLAREAGVPSNCIFNACGLTEFGYHSFPIVKMSSGKWVICEATLNWLPSSGPMLLAGSEYSCDMGLQNWRFTGHVKSDSGVRRVGVRGQTKDKLLVQLDTGLETNTITGSEPTAGVSLIKKEKEIEAIRKFWKNKDSEARM